MLLNLILNLITKNKSLGISIQYQYFYRQSTYSAELRQVTLIVNFSFSRFLHYF
jgi:hypothetical protein